MRCIHDLERGSCHDCTHPIRSRWTKAVEEADACVVTFPDGPDTYEPRVYGRMLTAVRQHVRDHRAQPPEQHDPTCPEHGKVGALTLQQWRKDRLQQDGQKLGGLRTGSVTARIDKGWSPGSTRLQKPPESVERDADGREVSDRHRSYAAPRGTWTTSSATWVHDDLEEDSEGRPYRQAGFPPTDAGLRAYYYGTSRKPRSPSRLKAAIAGAGLTDKQRAAVEAYLKHGTERAAAEALGIARASFQERLQGAIVKMQAWADPVRTDRMGGGG